MQLLRAHDVPYELMVFPDDVHDSLLFRRWIEAFEASDDFLNRKLVGAERVTTIEGTGASPPPPRSRVGGLLGPQRLGWVDMQRSQDGDERGSSCDRGQKRGHGRQDRRVARAYADE